MHLCIIKTKPLSAEKEVIKLRHKSLYAEIIYAKNVYISATETKPLLAEKELLYCGISLCTRNLNTQKTYFLGR